MNLLFSFFGRTGRGGFWLGVLASIVAVVAFGGLSYLLFGAPFAMFNADGTPFTGDATAASAGDIKTVTNVPAVGTFAVGYLLGAWTALATQVKRCHDRGFSGWWVIPMNIVPFWSLISLGVLEGQDGPNVYGSDPRAKV
jgi:uncharacterized membrane protein YhaH (DUF805 family)